MTNYFISTVRYNKTMENGLIKAVNEQYLVDALSFTEAETRTVEELKPYIFSEFTIPQITKSRISESLLCNDNDSADKYYKVKSAFITIDEKTVIEKRKNIITLVQASDFDDAYNRFLDFMKGTTFDYEVISIVETSILDFFPATLSNEEKDK